MKSSTFVKSLKKSSFLTSAPCADAVTATKVAEMTETKAKKVVNPTSPAFATDLAVVSPVSPILVSSLGLTAVITTTIADNTSTPAIIGEEVSMGAIPIINSAESSLRQDVRSNEAAGVKSYASLLKESATLEEIGMPVEHVSGAPFVLIPDDNIASAKEEFHEFIFARFSGDCPSMGLIIGIINSLWAKIGPRIFVHNVGQGEYLLKVTNVKTREILLGRTCWNIAGYPMFIAPRSPEFTPEEAPLTNVVVPVELRGVLYLLFNKESLSRLATVVGKPVSLAPETEQKENFQVAKLYVIVDLTRSSRLTSSLVSQMEGKLTSQSPILGCR
ncbi:hypothetical protein BRARA_E01532 [Brassica rapa]|uniref:DUF4283 domain-containing protein n=1 Tax=Brassica campestris TaxID=3711 RepID=A0A397Z9Y6_BRACM|nr:hypothetical protein BRARA_E01532 [Brassica rapa]